MEIWDILNKAGERTGHTIIRGKKLKQGQYHLVVHVWVLTGNGLLLIQKRCDDLKLMPGEWAATGGSALQNESSEQAALRELREELGISANESEMENIKRIIRYSSIVDLWILKKDVDVNRLVLQKSEVAKAKLVTPNELKAMVSQGQFHNYGKHYFKILMDYIKGIDVK